MVRSPSHGIEREARVRDIAAELGVADFVFTSPQLPKGSGATREVSGDGLLICGSTGAILQVKVREPTQAAADDSQRVRAWIEKYIANAEEQGKGARREIVRRLRDGNPITLLPARVRGLSVEKRHLYERLLIEDASGWPIIVVVEHHQAAGLSYQVGSDTFVITLSDWLELHRRLRSTYALINYVRRVLADSVSVVLGHEVERYTALYDADCSTDDGSAAWITELPPPDQ